MLTLEQFMKRLAHSQLKNESCTDDSQEGVILPEYEEQIISLINQGLEDLSNRMPLFKDFVDLTFVDGQNAYPLVEGAGYLDDTVFGAFTDDEYIKLLEVIDSAGKIYTVNSNGHIMLPSHNVVRFTDSIIETLTMDSTKVRLRYQKKHPKVSIAQPSISIPNNLVTALQLFVSSLYFTNMGGAEQTQQGDRYYGVYLKHLGQDEATDASSTSEVQESTKFEDRGFV